jgi:hypothetical protein
MPCYECQNGKWRFGETGKCQYDSKSECETANKDYYAEEEHDHHFHFTQEMMEKLHHDGELKVKVEEGDQEMLILFTYDVEQTEEYMPEEEIKDEFKMYFDEVMESLKKSK